ncbi:hypothetical protein ABZ897_08740 [Nonomuraea sp. NPDC046802]|uniref:hypothetical protein n=1 Tax=Nonomuraea sp. NPDC046802 TaxID=3154919 RepID=UPI0033DFEDBF
MIKSLAGTVLVAAAASTLMVAPASASSASSSTTASAGTAKAAVAARPQLIRTKVSFGRCKDTCRIKVRIKNKSRKTLFNVKLNANLRVNGRRAGACYDYVGTIKARKVKWASCTVRSHTLADEWTDYLDGSRFRYRASTSVYYRYYR